MEAEELHCVAVLFAHAEQDRAEAVKLPFVYVFLVHFVSENHKIVAVGQVNYVGYLLPTEYVPRWISWVDDHYCA